MKIIFMFVYELDISFMKLKKSLNDYISDFIIINLQA
jgi:hypothetical protein